MKRKTSRRGHDLPLTTADQEVPQSARVRLLHLGQRVGMPLPEAVLAVLFATAAVGCFLSPERLATLPPSMFRSQEELWMVLFIEGGFIMGQTTLIDIATRLRKRPPVWAIPLIVAVVFLLSPGVQGMMGGAWDAGAVVMVPLILTFVERATVLWHMPVASPVEKMGARAQISNRLITVLGLGGLLIGMLCVGHYVPAAYTAIRSLWPGYIAGAIYFAIAAFDEWRVRGRRFAERPRVLFGFDALGIRNTDRVW